jgi:hypothetical protein
MSTQYPSSQGWEWDKHNAIYFDKYKVWFEKEFYPNDIDVFGETSNQLIERQKELLRYLEELWLIDDLDPINWLVTDINAGWIVLFIRTVLNYNGELK